MTATHNARQSLRELVAGEECIFPASVYDPISVRIASEIGFEMGMFGGSVASLTVLEGGGERPIPPLSPFSLPRATKAKR